jgi:hypothetical protein
MADRGRAIGVSNIVHGGKIPLWLAVHEAGHVIARIQLVAAWRLTGLDNPVCLEAVRVWIDRDGTPRGALRVGI